jgi:hypothetical protein
MLAQVCFQLIKDSFWYGAYGEFRVIIDKTNGYVNATKMCRAGNKDYYDWSRLKSTQQLIQALQEELLAENTLRISPPGIPGTEIIQCFNVIPSYGNDVDRLVAGTYIHPDLVPSLAGWISPQFQLKANRVVNSYIRCQFNEKLTEYETKLAERIYKGKAGITLNAKIIFQLMQYGKLIS